MSFFLLSLFAALSPAEIREQANDPAFTENRTIAGYDTSDEAVKRAAAANCGPSPECADRFLRARDMLVDVYSDQRAKLQGRILKNIKNETRDGVTNWEWAALMTFQHQQERPRTPVTRCSTHVSKSGRNASTSCTTF